MTFTLTDLKPVESPTGRVDIVRFTVSLVDPERGPILDIGGWLLNPNGTVKSPTVYSQRGQRLGIITEAEWFREALEELFRTHPDLKGYLELLRPRLAKELETDWGLKTKVEVSLGGGKK